MAPHAEVQRQSTPVRPTEPASSLRPKCEGKEALCKAMGALFLQHRVETLESDVEKLQYKRREGRTRGTLKVSADGSSGSGSGGCPFRRDDIREAGKSRGKIQHESASEVKSRRSLPVDQVIVADASLLIYSLRTVHDWLKEGNRHIVVPMEALSTLDVLKKGEHHVNMAARKAMRFLDERCTRDDWATGEDVDLFSKHSGMKAGLFAQRDGQRLKPAEVEGLRMWLNDPGSSLRNPDQDDSTLALQQMPTYIRETLSCALWFLRDRINSMDQDDDTSIPSLSLALAMPPPHLDGLEGGAASSNLRYAERADGRQLMYWTESFCQEQVPACTSAGSSEGRKDWIIVAPTASSWLSAPCSVATARNGQATPSLSNETPNSDTKTLLPS